MSKQLHINWDMRSVLIDWLVSVAEEYQLENQTIHLSVNYLDRFLSNISVVSTYLNLLDNMTYLYLNLFLFIR